MTFKDIVNRDIVNLTNCEQEAIHIPGSIQPHGFLLGLKEDALLIDYCSANTAEYLSLFHSQLLGKKFEDVFGSEAADALTGYVAKGLMLSSTLLRLTLAGVDFLCTLHKNDNGIYILECEPVSLDSKPAHEVYDQTSQFLGYMHETHTLKELCQLVAKGTRKITGYDRVMIYRFDKDYNGEVFAESCRDDLEPFLGLHYPHTDIPAQARELYKRNLLRLISDINYTPIPVFTIDDAEGKNLDMSLAILRSTSPIHVQYLHNMGVGATLTISLLYKKKLWGLIACHHYSPKNLSPEIRLAAQLQGHFITSQIDVREASEEYEYARKSTIATERMNSHALLKVADLQKIIEAPQLLELCNAAGVSIIFGSTVFKHGFTPDDGKIWELADFMARHTAHGTFNTNKLIDYLPHFHVCDDASGIIYHSLDIDNNNCIIWYRPETQTEVNWAGDPNKSIEKDENGLSPRRSFELWKEIVDCMSKPWLRPEIESAASYAYSLQRQLNLLIMTQEEEKYRKLSELLKQTNSELENINWISTHDLQEPLRKIQLIASRILIREKEIPETVEDAIKRMNNAAGRMQTLLIDILKYTRLKHTDEALVKVDMNALLEDVKLDMAETISEKNAEVIVGKLPEIKGIPFLLKQLFSNLVANSIKYAAADRKPQIKITASDELQAYRPDEPETLYRVFYVADNGMGFEQRYAESIFNIFTRLHDIPNHKGSGVGLALCKKIMQNHNGHIAASSAVNQGTVISLYFPVSYEQAGGTA
ncbi:ATP-binding protein [Flavobacterium sp. RHBU_24]|uniref:ATP-binding protein n=1 Tax=Flavobacterium sp. RHBU_24 TaxID=3391185 RepID=UPI0039851E6F